MALDISSVDDLLLLHNVPAALLHVDIPMKALVVTGSRADRNGLEVVHEVLKNAGHHSVLCADWGNGWFNPDVAILGGDRSEILRAAVELSVARVPIAHIAGGDVTTGSADDRYRDAITALSCIHFATNAKAFDRLIWLAHQPPDCVYLTGSPAIDRIKQTPVLDKVGTFDGIDPQARLRTFKPTALVCVHPNTSGTCAPEYEAWVTRIALSKLGIQSICLGANADKGQDAVNLIWVNALEHKFLTGIFAMNVSPQLYYSLMTHCDVMVGNSSAMLYEAPCFGLPCVLVGDRQNGRTLPKNVMCAPTVADKVAVAVGHCLDLGRLQTFQNPYGDGHSAPRIVKALEENEWRWKRD